MRLIDADKIKFKWINGVICVEPKDIEKMPTVDAVPVIRCKDCKHMVEHKGYGYLGESAYTCESNMDGWILPDSYCSMAERKDGYVTLHHEDIRFIDEDAERAFYESLAERKEE